MTDAREPIAPVQLATGRESALAPRAAWPGVATPAAGAIGGVLLAIMAAWFVRWSRERVLPAEERAFRKLARALWLRPRERRTLRHVAAAHAERPPAVAVLISREAFESGAVAAREGGLASEIELKRLRRRVFGAA